MAKIRRTREIRRRKVNAIVLKWHCALLLDVLGYEIHECALDVSVHYNDCVQ